MAEKLAWCSLVMAIISTSLAVACVVHCSRLASRAIRAANRRSPSDATLAELAADQAALSSSFQSLTKTVKRLSSRHGMEELRSKRDAADDVPPLGASKAQLRMFYGVDKPGFAAEHARRVGGES